MAEKLAIVTWDTNAVDFYAQQIRAFFGNSIEISTYSVQAGSVSSITPADVYLVSTCAFSDRDISQLLPPGGKVVISEVRITKKGLDRLLAMPRKTQALLVNINKSMANETIATLNQLGVTNIQFSPYYPGITDPPRLDCAITTGESRYVPDWVEEVIDLGPRLLSGSTFTALAYYLNKEYILTKPDFQKYLASLAENTFGIEQMLHRSLQLENLAEMFQRALDSGVIGVYGNGNIFLCSDKASEILGIGSAQIIGHHFRDVLPTLPFVESLANRKSILDRQIQLGSQSLVVSIQPFYQNFSTVGAFCTIQRTSEREQRQRLRRQAMGNGHVAKYTFDSIIGESQPMQSAKALARKMASKNAAVLITGESGTGKELFAQAIHAASPRAQYPFVAINCAAMPDSLLESQLFGYEEGAFTGAKKGGSIGFFETAKNGTLFLDEIEAMSPMLQVKLLRVIQEKEIVRLGGVDVIHVDVRIIAASNQDLPTVVREGGFRKDLFYRLSVLPLQLPPLRERGMDIHLLFECIRNNLGAHFTLAPEALNVLLTHTWEGNVRELRNCVEYLTCLDKSVIEPQDLPFNMHAATAAAFSEPAAVKSVQPVPQPDGVAEVLEKLRRFSGKDLRLYHFLLSQLAENPSMGRKMLSKNAARLGLSLSEQTIRTLMNRMQTLELVVICRGRGGTHITDLGRSVADILSERHNQPYNSI